MNEKSNEEIRAVLASDPGSPLFVELAERLMGQGEIDSALRILLKGLTSSPNNHCGRLALAKAFYEIGAVPYAAREVEQLITEVPECSALKKLLQLIAPVTDSENNNVETDEHKSEIESTLAEAEFDFDDLDLVEDKQKKG